MTYSSAHQLIHAGIRYQWMPDSFLSRPQAEYAMHRLWRLIDSGQPSECPPVLNFMAATTADVERMFDSTPDELRWISLADALPPGVENPLDTSLLPIPCRSGRAAIYDAPDDGYFPFDLVAWTFLFLSRWEEVHRPQQLDQHGRVLASGLFAVRHDFHRRPVVDEWALIARMWIEHLRPGQLNPARRPALSLSHDVDHPLRFPSWSSVVRRCGGTLVRTRGRVDKALGELLRGVRSVRDFRHDPYCRRLRDLMEFEESCGLRGQFNFMASKPSQFDEGYDINSRALQVMLAEIRDRGHQIGWHPGYEAATDEDALGGELEELQQAAREEVRGGRHHYLRWDARASWDKWDALGIDIDGSVGFNDDVGFRCGTAHPYPVYSLEQERPLDLIESPLHVMDWGLFRAANNIDQQTTGAVGRELFVQILNRIAVVAGDASVLVHHDFHDWGFVEVMLGELRKWLGPLSVTCPQRARTN